MMLESGPAKGDRNYWLFVTLLCVIMTGWFVYDGAIGWPNKNRKAAQDQLANLVQGPLALGRTLTEAKFSDAKKSEPKTPKEIRDHFGEPTHREVGVRGAVTERFASLYGMATVTFADGRVNGMVWTTWAKTKADIDGQFKWAALPALIGLYTLYRLIRAATLRVVIDDDGIVYGGKRIPFATMVALRDYNPKGWVDLYHRVGEQERRLRLDNQKVCQFDEIVAALCEAKGFANPLLEEQGAVDAGEPDADTPASGVMSSMTKNLEVVVNDRDAGRITTGQMLAVFQEAVDNGDILLPQNSLIVVGVVLRLLDQGLIRRSQHVSEFEERMNKEARAMLDERRRGGGTG